MKHYIILWESFVLLETLSHVLYGLIQEKAKAALNVIYGKMVEYRQFNV